MKTVLILSSFILLAASSAFAAASIVPTDFSKTGLTIYGDKSDATTASAPLIGKTSTGVTAFMYTGISAYSVVTQHKNGIKAFGSSDQSTSIFSRTEVAGTITTKPPTDTTSAIFTTANGWTTM